MICDYTAQFDIRKLAQLGCHLPDRCNFAGGVLETTWTSTNFGGRRQWFLCPACNRRCAIIYCHSKTRKMGCRICLKGRYASEHMSPEGRRLHAAFAVRRRLGQKKGGIGIPFPPKPKGMHWRTYDAIRVAAVHEELNIWFQGYADICGIAFETAEQHFSKNL